MKTLVSLFFAPLFARAGIVCHGEGASTDPRKAGAIVYEISSRDCGAEGDCYRQIEKDRDVCKGAAAVMKMSCERGLPVSKLVACPPGTVCSKGACR